MLLGLVATTPLLTFASEKMETYILSGDGNAAVVKQQRDVVRLRHVVLWGHVQRPGVYFFKDPVNVFTLLKASGLIKGTELDSDLRSVNITQPIIKESTQGPEVYNYESLDAPGARQVAPKILMGCELIYVPWRMMR